MADAPKFIAGGATTDERIFTRIYWTNTTTGEIIEGWEVTNITTPGVQYFDTAGAIRATAAGEIRSREPIRIALSGTTQTVVNAVSTITVDAFANYAEIQVKNGVIFTLDGTDPSIITDFGFRIPGNAIITLESRDELVGFKVLAFLATEMQVQQYNTPPPEAILDI